MRSIYVKSALIVLFLGACFFALWLRYGQVLESQGGEGLLLIKQMEQNGIPSFEMPRLSGALFNVNQVKGKVAIINFWATWCEPCIREFPSMLKLVEHFKGDLVLVAISADSEKADIENFLSAFKGKRDHVEILYDPSLKVAGLFGTVKLPESFVVKKDLKLFRKIVGLENWYNPQVIDFFSKLIGAPERSDAQVK